MKWNYIENRIRDIMVKRKGLHLSLPTRANIGFVGYGFFPTHTEGDIYRSMGRDISGREY